MSGSGGGGGGSPAADQESAPRWAEAALRGYQRQIGALEMPEWEQTVERRRARGYGGAPRKSAKPATGLIDLDLIRGSTFPKAKPQQGMWLVVRQGLLRAALLPLYRRWWQRHVGDRLFVALLAAYLVYVGIAVLHCTADAAGATVQITAPELLTPLLVALALSILKSQIVACNESYMSSGGARMKASSVRLKRRHPPQSSSSLISNGTSEQGLSGSMTVPSSTEQSVLTGTASEPFILEPTVAPPVPEPGRVDSLGPFPSRSAETAPPRRPPPQTRSASHELVSRRRPPPPPRSLSADSPPSAKFPSPLPPSGTVGGPELRRRGSRQRAGRPKLVRIADLPETVDNYHTDSTDTEGKSDGDELLAELSPSSSTSALSKGVRQSAGGTATGGPGGRTLLRPEFRSPVSDSSAAEISCSERRDSDDCNSSRRSFVKAAVQQRRMAMGRRRWRRWTPPASSAESHAHLDAASQQTSGSDSDASYSSGESATSGHRDASSGWDNPLQTASNADHSQSPLPPHGGLGPGCTIWEGCDMKKVDLTTLDICSVIVNRVESMPQSTDYLVFGLVMSGLIALLPTLCRLMMGGAVLTGPCWPPAPSVPALVNATAQLTRHVIKVTDEAFGGTARERAVTTGCLLVTLLVTSLLFFLLSVVERSFKQRLLYAKYFCYLTSARRARKFELPHFRLKKVRNIKTWLSVRSCLKKRGPQRSIDSIVSAACLTTVVLVTLLCVELLENSDSPRIDYYRIQLVVWCFSLGVYLVRVMSLGSYINRKYRNLSVVLTEQINLYLQIEQKPHKKERLVLANNVLKLASDLLKELENPFTVLGFSANPFLYNATKVIVLSACSGVLSDMLGFKLKLYKIKLK
ncbi:putative homeodomain transcription factor [Amphibalanus amphitrite]|uniref:Putative homeodomain transcription factor n=1 Tax=Amphibalanus amphitrite TaxID=1232801 RepID=A0A6A4V658_AMPAM|nr:putative homeodomain transcription factor [Amphibalanus amphitrite]